jgi:hypothetical protein
MDPATVTTDYGSAVFLQRVVALIATLPGLFSYLAYRSVGSTQAAEVVGEKVRRAR